MLCCLDASVANDDYMAHTRTSRRPSKKKKEFEEVQMQMGSHARLNGRIPAARKEPSVQSSETEGDAGEDAQSEPRGEKEEKEDHHEGEPDDVFSQMDLMQHQLHQLQKERDDYKSRLSWYASSALRDGNPNIVDLSDPNRPDALSQRAAELYDNQWTDAFIYLTDNRMDEKAAITVLVDMLRTVYRVCKTLASQQMNSLGSQIGFFTGFEEVPPYLLPSVQMYKDERKKNYKKFLPILEKKARKYVKTVRGLGDYFFLEALETCWLLCIQDPPMTFDFACFPGDVFDSKTFRPFTTPGSHVDYIVWPALRLHEGGPLLTKGFAQGRKGGIPTHHSVTRRLTSEPRTVYRRRDNSAHLSKISESSQEYQTSFPSSHRSGFSKSQSSRSSKLYMSGYDTKSEASKIASIRDQHRREKDFKEFLKNADFKTEEEIDASEKNDQNEAHDQTERFALPGRQNRSDAHGHVSKHQDTHTNQNRTQSKGEQSVDSPITSDRSFMDEETQTSNHATPSPMKPKHAVQADRYRSPDRTKGPSQHVSTLPVSHTNLQPETGMTKDAYIKDHTVQPQYLQRNHSDSSDDEFYDDTLDDEMGCNKEKHSRAQRSFDMPYISEDAEEDSNTVQPNYQTTSLNQNVSPKTPIAGILKTEKRDILPDTMSPSRSESLSAKRAAVRKQIERTRQRNTPTSSTESRSVFSETPTPLKTDQGNALKDETDRKTVSPVRELSVKINKIKRIPKRIYPDDIRNPTNETRQPRGKIRAYNRTSQKTIHSCHVHHTPRNVPSVESGGVSSLDTIVLSRNTPRKPSDITPRHTTRTVTPVPTHRSNVNSRHKKAFEYDPKFSREDSKHVHDQQHSKESHNQEAANSSRLTEREYVSRALTDYTPRHHRGVWRAPPVVKQYPAMTPDFSNSLTLAHDTGAHSNFLLAPKPPPKIPGTVAANLRFATN